ncbi:MAG: hypothetical protein Q3990_09720 [Desulfovibrionaceae bacterium]|nr:hypothetical protein [Desulfovibrionaceae bacterium]
MRYIKAFLILCVFFVAMIFFFQNHAVLSKTVAFQLNLLVMPSMTSIEIPFYFVMLGAFLLGSLLCLAVLLFDRIRMSLCLARANMRVRSIESNERKMLSKMKMLSCSPEEKQGILSSIKAYFTFSRKKDKAEEAEQKKTANGKDEYINEFFKETSPDDIESSQATMPSEKTTEEKNSQEKDTQKAASAA